MENPVVHFEILGPHGDDLIHFYRGLFGWPLENEPLAGWPTFAHLRADVGISGAVGSSDVAPEGGVLIYVEVRDLAEYIERSLALGGLLLLPSTHIAGANVQIAWLRDPAGNIVGLVQSLS